MTAEKARAGPSNQPYSRAEEGHCSWPGRQGLGQTSSPLLLPCQESLPAAAAGQRQRPAPSESISNLAASAVACGRRPPALPDDCSLLKPPGCHCPFIIRLTASPGVRAESTASAAAAASESWPIPTWSLRAT